MTSGFRPDLRLRVPEHVKHRDFPEQTVVLNLQSGQYHGLNQSAGALFALLARGATLAETTRTVSERFGISREHAERSLHRLCADLLERGLVEPVDHPAV
jgi:PqqD family protein of HPr-rel-A system